MKLVRCQYLKEAIPGLTGPFAEIAGWAKEDAEKVIDEASGERQSELNDMLLKVQMAFDRTKKRKDNDTDEGKMFRKELHELVEEARRILNGATQESLDACKQYK
jgi:hypothetical protein